MTNSPAHWRSSNLSGWLGDSLLMFNGSQMMLDCLTLHLVNSFNYSTQKHLTCGETFHFGPLEVYWSDWNPINTNIIAIAASNSMVRFILM